VCPEGSLTFSQKPETRGGKTHIKTSPLQQGRSVRENKNSAQIGRTVFSKFGAVEVKFVHGTVEKAASSVDLVGFIHLKPATQSLGSEGKRSEARRAAWLWLRNNSVVMTGQYHSLE
jgi:hypothetical protein